MLMVCVAFERSEVHITRLDREIAVDAIAGGHAPRRYPPRRRRATTAPGVQPRMRCPARAYEDGGTGVRPEGKDRIRHEPCDGRQETDAPEPAPRAH